MISPTKPIKLMVTMLLAALLTAGQATATTLLDYNYAALPDGSVRVTLKLDEAIQPNAFSIADPARIVIDLPATNSKLPRTTQAVDAGAVDGLVALEAAGRTRVVFKLKRAVDYKITPQQNNLIVDISNKATAGTLASSSPSSTSAHAGRIENIDFARDAKGAGKVLVTLSDPDMPVATRQQGGKIVVDFMGASIDEALARRLDVTDFGTPAQTITIVPQQDRVQMTISASGAYDQLAYQVNDTYTVELQPLTREQQQLAQRKRKSYTGDRLSLNFQNIEVRAVLQLLADFTGKNLVASDSVSGNVTLRLKNVPWDQALAIILNTKGLAKREDGNVMWIAPAEEVAARERQELEAQQQLQELAPLYTEYVPINFAKATAIASLLQNGDSNLLTERGSVTIDERTNTLIVRDTEEKLAEIQRLISTLDVPIRQVLIESRIVNASTDFAKNMGVRFGYSSSEQPGRTVAFTGSSTAAADIVNGTSVVERGNSDRFQVNLPSGGLGGFAPTSAALAIAKLPFGNILELELSALQSEGRGEILSSPRVVTSNQQEAVIEQGTEIAYQEASSSGATSTSFKKAVLSLKVTPQITPDDHIVMDLDVSKDAVGALVGGVPTIDTQSVTTQVLVNNGETIVIGGIYERTSTNSVVRTPFLGELPYVGRLFQNRSRTNDKAELLVFVTPKLLRDGEVTTP